MDYGSQWKTQGIIAYEPPRIGNAFPVMVPQVDADGIDLGGIRLPEVAVPLGTYTGWNPRPSIEERYQQRAHYLKPVQIKTACLQPEKVVLSGVRRLVAAFRSRPESCYGDQGSPPNEKRRPVAALHSVRLIYAQASHYLGQIAEAALKLVKEGYLLPEELPALIERAGRYWEHTMKGMEN